MIKPVDRQLHIAMLSIHSNPLGKLGTKNTGGMSVYIRELSRELGKAGHKIDIYTLFNGENRDREIGLMRNVRMIHLDLNENKHIPKNSLYKHIPDLFRSLDSYRNENGNHYDLVHSHYWLSGLLGSEAQHQWQIPHVMTFHTTGMVKKVKCAREQEPSMRLIKEKKLAFECSRVLAPTQRERDFLIRFYKVPLEKIGIVPCGVNLDQFHVMRQDVARQKLGLSSSQFIILFVGRFVPVKGIERLIASISHLRHKRDIGLVIVGGDGRGSESTAALRRLTRRANTDAIVKFAGRIDHKDLHMYYNAADILVIPSFYESFGLVALESLACGTPVVATQVGAMENVIQEGLTGSIVKRPSPRSLASAIEKLRSPENGLMSRDDIRTSILDHSWSVVASRVIQEYVSVIDHTHVEADEECLVS